MDAEQGTFLFHVELMDGTMHHYNLPDIAEWNLPVGWDFMFWDSEYGE